MTARRQDAWKWAIAAVVAAGAIVRFATLGVQSMWLDEAVTRSLVTRSLGGMLRAIPHSESTPPLFYVLEWAWAHVFGFGAVALRSLPALLGTATIVVLAAIAGRLGGRRAALAAAALAASSPLLIWYSQEARAYALLLLLCAVSVWCLVRADWRGWALAAALALATHYFALFIVVPEALWLASRHGRSSRRAAFSLGAVVLAGAALAPLAIVQASGDRARFISATGLGSRIAAVPKQFLIGYATPHATVLTALAVLAAAVLAVSLRPRDGHLLALAAIGVLVPIALALAGADYVITRNLITAMVPLVVVAGLAAARTRAGTLAAGLLCAAGIVAFAGVELTPADQRDDWRGVASAIGPAALGPRVVVVDPSDGAPALAIYLPLRRVAPSASTYLTIREVDVIDVARNPALPAPGAGIPGFAPQPVVHTGAYTLQRYVAAAPLRESYAQIAAVALVPGSDVNGGPAILAGG